MKALTGQKTTIFLLCTVLLGFSTTTIAQSWERMVTNTGSGTGLYQLSNSLTAKLRLGEFEDVSEFPYFYIRKNSLQEYPFLQLEAFNNRDIIGSVKFLYQLSTDEKWGIYQQGTDFNNRLEGNLQVGSGLTLSGTAPFNILGLNNFPITRKISPSGAEFTPMIIGSTRVRIIDTLECTDIQVTRNPGEGNVLISNTEGNGRWINPVTLSDGKWLINKDNDLFAHYSREHVGIGFTSPENTIYQRLHVVDGNILISTLHETKSNSCSQNGAILFSDIASEDIPNGRWGIEYKSGESNGSSNSNTDENGGLNFKLIENRYSAALENCLYLKNNGFVGIGTAHPKGQFQVGDGNEKSVIGCGPNFIYDDHSTGLMVKGQKNTDQIYSGLGYLGFNTFFSNNNWVVEGDGTSNAGTLIYNSPFGSMYFCTVPISEGHSTKQLTQTELDQATRLTITNSGDIGVGTMGPGAALDVVRRFNAKIRCNSVENQPSSIWLENGRPEPSYIRNSYGLVLDADGICHLSANIGQPSSIMTFQAGANGVPSQVGVAGNLDIDNNVNVSDNLVVTGKLGVGAVDLSEYSNSTSKLFVEGGITTEAVHVKLQASGWSDFVFADDYKIRSISELDQFIKSNKHLPDIPKNSDVEANGIDLGKMNALLLQKIEELTLYIIDQQKQIDLLKRTIK